MVPYIAIVVYTLTLALKQVNTCLNILQLLVYILQIVGLDVDISCSTMFVVCVFYTSVGGTRALVWTDCFQVQRLRMLLLHHVVLFQLFFMFLSTITILILATVNAGGMIAVFDKNYQDGRIQFFNMEFDPRERHAFWEWRDVE